MLVDSGFTLAETLNAALAPDDTTYHQVRFGASCYSGVKLDADGNQYYMGATGSWFLDTTPNTWLITGTNDRFWVRATLNSGTLDHLNSGTGSWLQLNADRNWSFLDATTGDGADTVSLKLEIATSSTGSNILATETYTMSAFRIS